jgi:hypothetical protein
MRLPKLFCLLILVIIFLEAPMGADFKKEQLRYSRVRAAYKSKGEWLKGELARCGISSSGIHIYLRAFKLDRQLEVWVKGSNQQKYLLLTTYPFCASSGVLGPKRRQGDLQIPEGFYHIDRFNA